MNTPKAITEATRRYLDYLDAELREVQFSRDREQEDLERRIARVNECDRVIKQIRADQEEIRKWLEAQKGGKRDGPGRNDLSPEMARAGQRPTASGLQLLVRGRARGGAER